MEKILIVNSGSLGDIHPFMGIAKALQKEGAEVLFVSSEYYREYILSFEIPFASAKPDLRPDDPEIIKAVLDQKKGPEILHKEYIFKHIKENFDDLLVLSKGYDLILCGILSFAVPTVAELRKIPWVCGTLSPIIYWSSFRVPVLPQTPKLHKILKLLGPTLTKYFFKAILSLINTWAKPLHNLRKENGLTKSKGPYSGMMHSPYLNLALFSKHFCPPQNDWPQPLIQTGFVSFDASNENNNFENLDEETKKFINSGDPPILFTLGSTASENPKKLLDIFLKTANLVAFKCLFVIGKSTLEKYEKLNSEKIHFTSYIPYSSVMPLCKAIIHQGGIGTTAQAMKSASPSIIIGEVNDQPDNGENLSQTGIGAFFHFNEVNAEKLAQKIIELVSDSNLKEQCKKIAHQMQLEDAQTQSAKALLKLIKDTKN